MMLAQQAFGQLFKVGPRQIRRMNPTQRYRVRKASAVRHEMARSDSRRIAGGTQQFQRRHMTMRGLVEIERAGLRQSQCGSDRDELGHRKPGTRHPGRRRHATREIGDAHGGSGSNALLVHDDDHANRTPFTARVSAATTGRPGSAVRLTVNPQAFHFFDPATGSSLAYDAAVAVA